jgi:hypothetical protein
MNTKDIKIDKTHNVRVDIIVILVVWLCCKLKAFDKERYGNAEKSKETDSRSNQVVTLTSVQSKIANFLSQKRFSSVVVED